MTAGTSSDRYSPWAEPAEPPPAPPAGAAEWDGMPSEGDSVIQLRNDYENEVFNGDVGRVSAPAWRDGRVQKFKVTYGGFEGGGGAASGRGPTRVVEYTRAALGKDVALSYALTVHKAQGSEYPVVVMPVLPQHGNMLYRNLLYTGFSRAKQLLVLVGTEAAVRSAVENDSRGRRVTLLAERVDDRDFAPPTTRHMSEW